MIMKQRKNTETISGMTENKDNGLLGFSLAGGILTLLGTGGIWTIGYFRQIAGDRLLGNCVLSFLGILLMFFCFWQEKTCGQLDYGNEKHPFRFVVCVAVGLLLPLACAFLPVGGWPFLPLFVMLASFSNADTGILSASVLLLMAVFLNADAIAQNVSGVFAMYFISGIFAVMLLQHLEKGFRIGLPLISIIVCLLVCETAALILTANARPEPELFVIPVANMVISSVLLIGFLKLFSSQVVYQYREIYLEINDTENQILTEFRQENRQDYMLCVHTAYFCERIGRQLGLDTDALKGAAYYHRFSPEKVEEVSRKFPPAVREILLDYNNRNKGVCKKETAVLLCADRVVSFMMYALQNKAGKKLEYEKITDALFEKMEQDGIFDRCNIEVVELRTMQRIFREEKLYYDFLH